MRLEKGLLVGLFVASAGCTTTLTSGGAKVQILTGSPQNCRPLGDVFGSGVGAPGQNIENARNDIRNKAAEKGANFVDLQTNNQTDGRVDFSGVAYECSDNTPASSPVN